MSDVKFNWRDRMLIISFLVSVVLLFGWFLYYKSNGVVYTFWYDHMMNVSVSTRYYEYDCAFEGCSHTGNQEVETKDFYDTVSGYKKASALLAKVDDRSGLRCYSSTFSYTDSNTQTSYEKNTYLVPQKDGSFKLENKVDKIETTYLTSKEVGRVSYSAYYCYDHAEAAMELWKEDIHNVFKAKNIGYYVYKFGYLAGVLGFVITFLLSRIFPGWKYANK